MAKKTNLNYKICGSYQVQDCTGRNGIVHHARRMTRCCNISSLGQMALESTTCGILHHARRTRAHCPTMVSSFKLSSGTVCLLGFSCRAGHIRKGKYKICGSYQVQDCTGRNGFGVRDAQCRSYQCSLALGRNHKSYIYLFLYDQLCN